MNYIPIGTIANTHGLDGTLKVVSDSDFKHERFQLGQLLYIHFQQQYMPVTVASHRSTKGLDYLRFEEFFHINDVERFKGCDLFVDDADRAPLEAGEFYYDDLVGMTVQAASFSGTVIAVRDMPQGAMLVVNTATKDILIPFHKAFVEDVDTANGIIHVIDWEGLA